MQGDIERAAILAEEGLAMFRTYGLRGGTVELLITRGEIAVAQGARDRALVQTLRERSDSTALQPGPPAPRR